MLKTLTNANKLNLTVGCYDDENVKTGVQNEMKLAGKKKKKKSFVFNAYYFLFD